MGQIRNEKPRLGVAGVSAQEGSGQDCGFFKAALSKRRSKFDFGRFYVRLNLMGNYRLFCKISSEGTILRSDFCVFCVPEQSFA
jgi:hypothetical protein